MKEIDKNSKLIHKSKAGWFVRNPRVTILIVIIIIFWGVMSLITIPKEDTPEVDFGLVSIGTMYVGASASDIDSLVTQEIEKKIKDVEGINKINSSSRNSFSSILIEFDPGEDMTKAVANVRTKIDEAKHNLPSEAEDPILKEITSSDRAIFNLILTGPYDSLILRDYGEQLENYLETVPEVNNITINGGNEKEINIKIDPFKLNQYNLTLGQLRGIIAKYHTDQPIGEIEIENLEYNIKYKGKFKTAEDIKEIPIKAFNSEGTTMILLKDIAEVIEEAKDPETITKFFNKKSNSTLDAVTLAIYTRKRAGIFNSDKIIREKTNKYTEENFPPNLNISYTNESADRMKDSYSTVYNSAIQTIIIVFLAMLFFLGLKEALITATIVPLTFFVTFTVLKSMDSTLNMMTNFSMILAIGILVDTAIVIVEGVYNHIEQGYDSKSSAQLAINEFISPLTAGTLTTLAVFIPLISLPGMLGQYLSFIPITVSITLVASLLISLTINPTFSSLLLKKRKEIRGKIQIRSFIKRFLKFIETSYNRFVLIFIKTRFRRLGAFYIIFILFLLTFLIPIKFTMFPSSDTSMINIHAEKTIGTTKGSTLKAIKPIEKVLSKIPEIKSYELNVTDHKASFQVELTKKEIREEKEQRPSLELEDDLAKELASIKGLEIKVVAAAKGPPSEFPVGFRVIIKDPSLMNTAQKTIRELKEILKSIEGTTGVTDDMENVPGDFYLKIDKKLAVAEGVDPLEIPSLIRTALQGSTIAIIDRNNVEIDVNLKLKKEEIKYVNEIKNLEIINKQGNRVKIGKFIELNLEPGLNLVKRRNNQISLTVSSLLEGDTTTQEVTNKMLKKLKDYETPDGITIENAGENAEQTDLLMALIQAFIIAVIIIFTILVTQFNSFSQPFLIILTIIFAQLGVNIGLYLTNTPRSLAFIIGAISLAGIVVNDAIIMVDQINRNRKRYPNKELLSNISSSSASRLQPIILTTLTTTAGIAPLVFIDAFWAGLGYTVIFGLSVASFLTLFITPGMYYQFENDLKFTIKSFIIFIIMLALAATPFLIS